VANAQGGRRLGGMPAFAGAVGLLLTPIAGVLFLMSLGTDRHDALLLFGIVLVGLALLGQAVGYQAELPLSTTAAWMVTALVLGGLIVIVGVVAEVAVAAAGLPASIVVIVLLTFVSARLEEGSARAATLRALWRAILGRSTDVDRRFLARGPSVLWFG
jgi:hypothetical protein